MKQATYDYDKKDDDDTLYMSIMPCDCICNFAASKAVWQELIRTHKALDRAKLILKNLLPNLDGYERLDVEKSIKEIKALEQKDK